MAEGNFPLSILLGERAVAWVEDEIEEWIINKIEQRNTLGSDKNLTDKIAEITEADVITFIKQRFSAVGTSSAITWFMQIIK